MEQATVDFKTGMVDAFMGRSTNKLPAVPWEGNVNYSVSKMSCAMRSWNGINTSVNFFVVVVRGGKKVKGLGELFFHGVALIEDFTFIHEDLSNLPLLSWFIFINPYKYDYIVDGRVRTT